MEIKAKLKDWKRLFMPFSILRIQSFQFTVWMLPIRNVHRTKLSSWHKVRKHPKNNYEAAISYSSLDDRILFKLRKFSTPKFHSENMKIFRASVAWAIFLWSFISLWKSTVYVQMVFMRIWNLQRLFPLRLQNLIQKHSRQKLEANDLQKCHLSQ